MFVHYCRQYHAITKCVGGPKILKGIVVSDYKTRKYAHIDNIYCLFHDKKKFS